MTDLQEEYTNHDTKEKRMVRAKINQCIISDPDIRRECKGLIILVYTEEEYHVMLDALKEVGDRKEKENIVKMEKEFLRRMNKIK
jgi:hypothetical protein